MNNCQASEIKKKSEVSSTLGTLEHVINDYSVRLDDLANRLQSVLRDQGPQTCTEPCQQTNMVPLAQAITNEAGRINYNNLRLQDLLDRLEL